MFTRLSWQVSVSLVLSCLLLVFPNSLRAQREMGTVKSAPLPVYAEASTDSDTVATLPAAKSVQITFSVTNADGAWCKVATSDTGTNLGYVRCDGLDRPNAPSTAATGPGTLLPNVVDPSTNTVAPARAQKDWAIAASAILASYNHESLDTLSSGGSVLRFRELLQNGWGISNRDELLQALDAIDRGGHRQLFSALGARTANIPEDNLKKAVSHMNAEDANSVIVAHRYYEQYRTQSITAWDYARYINVCRWGVAAGYISEEEALPRVMRAARILQQTFTSWNDFGENYLVGREFWSLSQTRIDGQQMRAVYEKLLNDPASPWRRIPWNLSLEQAPLVPNLAANVPEAQRANPGTAEGRCGDMQRAIAGRQASEVGSVLQSDPALIKCTDSHGWTPLHEAAFYGQTAMIGILVAHGATIDASDKDGATPLHVAASQGAPDVIETLIKSGARVDVTDHKGATPLIFAVQAGSVPATEMLLNYHAAIDKRCSCNSGSPLYVAASAGNTEVARLLLEHGANTELKDKDGYTPLAIAAWFGNKEMVSLLLNGHADADARDKSGRTPLYGAAKNGFVEIATLLLDHGARLEARDSLGFTPLHMTAENDRIEIAELLVARGADINARTYAGDTPLHWAAHENKLDAARFLLAKGAEIDPKDKNNETPLHWAAGFGGVEMTEFLIEQGADLKAKTRLGCTPLRGAYDWHRTDTAKVLLQHGATM